MRIVIDIQGAQTESRFRGIGRYTLSLVQALVRNCGEHEVILALSGLFPETIQPIRDAFRELLPSDKIRVWNAPGPVRECEPDNCWRREAAEGLREAFLTSLQPDVVLVTSLFEGLGDDAVTSVGVFDRETPVAVILYDLIPLNNPDEYFRTSTLHKNYYHRKIESLKRGSCLLAISESSRREVLESGINFKEHEVINISGTCEDWFRHLVLTEAEIAEVKRKFGIGKNYVMYTGGADERKNLPRLIRAYSALSPDLRQRYQLVMVGKMPEQKICEFRQIATKSGLIEDELIFTGYVENDDLVKLYNVATLFVFPSLHEGLGLPPLEAMACGVPVIAAKATSLPEIIGLEDALFDPNYEADIASKLTQALCDDSFRLKLVAHGLQQVKKFSWDKSAHKAIKALENLVRTKENKVTPTTCNQVSQAEQSNQVREIQKQVYCKKEDEVITDLVNWLASNEGVAKNIELQRQLAACIDLSIPDARKKRYIFLDISNLICTDAKTGIQRVVRSLLQQLLLNASADYEIVPVYATIDRLGYFTARKFAKAFCEQNYEQNDEDKLSDELISFKNGDIFLGLDLAAHIIPVQKKFYELMRYHGVRVYFVVYDLLPVLLPKYFTEEVVDAFKQWLQVIMVQDGALCISRAVAEELLDWIRSQGLNYQHPFDISWFHLGADIENSHPSLGLPQNAGLMLATLEKEISFLMVGTIEPRKGHVQTLAAFEQLWKRGTNVNLVIVGKQGWKMNSFVDRLRHHEQFSKKLFWFEGISDEFLEKIYATAQCLIASSEGEGFGLPLIEAAKKKLPIIARDIPVFREVASTHAFYFKGNEPADLSNAILEWLQMYKKGEQPKSDDMSYLVWKQSAKQLLDKICID